MDKILVAYDGTEPSRRALHSAAMLSVSGHVATHAATTVVVAR